MSALSYLIAAVFLPLFPASMLFNQVFRRVDNVWLRVALVMAWPLVGVLLLMATAGAPPRWIVYWGALTALLYAFRALALKDLGIWVAYMATSSWALLWLVADVAAGYQLVLHALGFSIPFALLVWLTARLTTLFGAAYVSASWGAALTVPRLSGILVISILAAIGTPLFPGFFTLFAAISGSLSAMPAVVLLVLLVWLLWTWSGSRILQGLVVGPASSDPKMDLGGVDLLVLGALLLLATVAGVTVAGEWV